MIDSHLIESDEELKQAFDIREKVYIEEQQIDRADEFDEFDDSSRHFIAYYTGKPAGTARYRQTDEGFKLERFAVLPDFRKKGIASAIMEAMLIDIKESHAGKVKLYLNAQLSAMPLYEKFDFIPEGNQFMECDIPHQKMSRYAT